MNAFKSTADINKETIRELARNGEPKPQWDSMLGVALSRYITPSYPNGPAFSAEIKALRLDWYLDTVDINKEDIREIARNGFSKPTQKTRLGRALNSYIKKTYTNGPAFRAELTALRPDWFSQVDINKAEILKIARNGEPRPSTKTKLGKDLSNYIQNCGGSFDQVVRDELKAIRPDWFRK